VADARDALLERYGRFYGDEHLAITFTSALEGDDAKRVTTKGWDKTAPLPDAAYAAGLIGSRGLKANPAVVLRPSNLIVLECDTEADLVAVEELKLPETITVRSSAPYKRHWWFRPPMELGMVPYVAFRFESGRLTADSGRYFLVPPSLHPSGAIYSFLPGRGPDEVDIAELPEAAYAYLAREARQDDDDLRERISTDPEAKIQAGKRREMIFRYACQQQRWGIPYESILRNCQEFNLTRCLPPVEEYQVKTQVDGAMKYPAGEEIRYAMPKADPDDWLDDHPGDPRTTRSDDGVIWLEGYELKEARYIDRPLIQAATFTLVGGRPGVGKGALCAHWVARCTTGRMYPEPRRVLWLSSEDDPSIDLGPRVEAAGGDRSMVGLIPHTFQLPASADWLIARLRDFENIGLVIIDPISNHTGTTNTDRENEVRTALMPLGVIAHELDVPILGVRHITTKEAKGGALMHILGSTAWIGVPRVVLAAVKDPTDPETVHVKPIKGNRVPISEAGRQFHLDGHLLPGFNETVVVARDVGASEADIDTMLAGEAETKSQKAESVIVDVLQQNGGVMESDALDFMVSEQTGLKAATLRKVRTKLRDDGVIRHVADRDDYGRATTWQVHLTTPFMPEEAEVQESEPSDDPHGPRARARAGEQEKNTLLLFPGVLHPQATTHQEKNERSGDLQGLSDVTSRNQADSSTTHESTTPPREESKPKWDDDIPF